MAKSSNLAPLLMHTFHYLVHNFIGIYFHRALTIIYFNEDKTLRYYLITFTCVSTAANSLILFLRVARACISFFKSNYLPRASSYFRMISVSMSP
jgi:hypothetical protein